MSEKSKSFAAETNRHADASTMNTPWLEWKDFDLNNEKWEIPKDDYDGLFLDAECVGMPRSLEPYQWIRARDLKHLTVLFPPSAIFI
ncbi:hypothetical protein X777_05030 [Ooceraea biroi]|uniref:Uncharacterized protein n=1 Tax=Ooceraea biroi TaxID=2015173 RepID=A0A026WF49_OOCBI|nr:hypothetical protein X777_05030 [Ooceraea biroi]